MKKFLYFTLFVVTLIALAKTAKSATLKFVGPCSPKFIMKTNVTGEFANVGELTVATLKKFNIPFLGTEQGLNSAFNTPVGMDAMEIISDEEMRAYGWCYSVDGFAPEVFPHEIPMTPEIREITWTFGFAHYYRGNWITQCTPAHTVRPAFLCEDKP